MLESTTSVAPLLRPETDAPSWQLFLVVIVAELLPFLFGYSIGFTSPTFADCDGSAANAVAMNCDLHLSSEQKSLFGSIICVGALVGALAGGPLLDPSGRKAGMLGAALLYTLGWCTIAMAPVPHPAATQASTALLTTLFLGRTLSGVAIGFTCCVVNIYVSELAPITLRGALGTLFQLNVVAGLLFAYLCGIFMVWRPMAWLVTFLAAGVTLLLLLLPESPQWLLQRGRRADADRALRSLRSRETPVAAILDSWEAQGDATTSSDASWLRDLQHPSTLRPLLVGVGLAVLQQFSGINSVIFYCGEIFAGVFSKATADAAAVGVQGLHLLMTAVTIPLMDRAGRRPLLLSAGAGMALCSFLYGLYYALEGTDRALPKVFAVAMVYGYMFSFALGMGSIPWLIIGEIFPPHAKGLCSSIATAVNWGSSFVVTKTMVNVTAAVGFAGLFWMYAAVLLLGLVFIYFFVPETKGRSFAEIQAAFEGRGGREYVAVATHTDA